jgi:hypothetical protein
MSPDIFNNPLAPEAIEDRLDSRGESPEPAHPLPVAPAEGDFLNEDDEEEYRFAINAPARHFGALAKANALAKLQERLGDLGELGGYRTEAAQVLAATPVDPAIARRILEQGIGRVHPTTGLKAPDSHEEIRVPGGTLLVAPLRVWAHSVIPDPGNFRCAEIVGSPFLGRPLALGDTPIPDPVLAGNGNEVKLVVKSRAHLLAVAEACSSKIKNENKEVIRSVPKQGVMMPVYGVVAEIYQEDTQESRHVVITPDGSSRVTACHLTLGITADDVVYGFPGDPGAIRRMVEGTRRVASASLENLSEADLDRNRVMTIPMMLIFGFRPDPNSSQDFASAIRSLVGMIHVDPPKEWPKTGEREAQASAVCHALDKHLPVAEMAYIRGMQSPDEAVEAGFSSYLDCRMAHIFHLMTRPRATPYRSIHDGIAFAIRSVLASRDHSTPAVTSGRIQATMQYRHEVAWELSLRPVRGAGTLATKIATVRAATDRVFPTDFFRDKPWQIDTTDPDALLGESLKELQADGAPGSNCRTLVAMGTWWLCIAGALVRAKAQDQEKVWREPAQVVADLANRKHGLRIFHAAVVAGRAAQDAGALNTLSIPRLTESGAPELSGDGTVQAMTASWLRAQVSDAIPEVGTSAPTDPRAQWNRRWSGFVSRVNDLHSEFFKSLLTATLEDGRTVVSVYGIPHDQADELEGLLTQLTKRMGFFSEVSRSATEDLFPDPELELEDERGGE